MICARRLETIRLADVVVDSSPLVCTVRGPAPELINSLSSDGLINPPLLRYRTVVCGYRRINAAKVLGWERVHAWIVPEEAVSLEAAMEISLRDNLVSRGLSEAEKARAVGLLTRELGASRDRVASHFLPLMGRAPSRGTVETYLAVGSCVSSVLALLDAGRIGLGTARALAPLTEAEQQELCRLLDALGSGVNVNRELVEGILDLSLREGRAIGRVLEEDWIACFLRDPGRRPQFRRLLDELRLRRRPRYEQARRADVKRASAWSAPAGVHLEVPPGREGRPWSLSIRFRTPNELRQKLARIADEDRFAELESLMGTQR